MTDEQPSIGDRLVSSLNELVEKLRSGEPLPVTRIRAVERIECNGRIAEVEYEIETGFLVEPEKDKQ